ncbi:hypothetical protein C2G38_2179296 [Gigaspora rosea]|uniref:Uncharacterized protein n=1 Tax=Gigaspora rosea TaxID=44941 RepID=A0A397VMP1_9GLOM|nr:hypothetical protein C2G38_2179296 [Gigaspora rosea]
MGLEKKKQASLCKFADTDNAVAINKVGFCYRSNGIGKDEHKAFEFYQKSADMGNVEGTHMIEEGFNLTENIMFDTVNYRHLGTLETLMILTSQTQQNQRGLMFREQRLLDVYVYDYLKRNRATKTAIAYLKECDILQSFIINESSYVDTTSLPDVDVPTQASEGFLYEWWTVFWDIYSAKLNHSGTVDMHNYVDQDQQSLDQQQRRLLNIYVYDYLKHSEAI